MIHPIGKYGYASALSWVASRSCPSPIGLCSDDSLKLKVRHALYIFRRVNPLGPFLSNAQPPRIPFDIPFALLHTVILLGFAVLAQCDDPTQGIHILVPNYARVYAIAAIAPTYCILTGQGLANIAWWSFTFMAVSFHQFLRSLIHQGRSNISQLEALRYDARGA
jgi:hypothetical protein